MKDGECQRSCAQELFFLAAWLSLEEVPVLVLRRLEAKVQFSKINERIYGPNPNQVSM